MCVCELCITFIQFYIEHLVISFNSFCRDFFFLFTHSKVHFFSFWPCYNACRILVPQPGIKPGPLAVKVPSPNHWAAREFPSSLFLMCYTILIFPQFL